MLKIRRIEPAEIPLLKNIAPPDWKSDISAIFAFHFNQSYFHPVVADLDGTIVGCAQGILNGKIGWLGNIIVRPDQRGRGIGQALTAHMVEAFHKNECKTQLLIATPLGEPVYRKSGFEISSRYVFFKQEKESLPVEFPAIQKFNPADRTVLFALDQAVTGEDRQLLLGRFLADAWIYRPVEGQVIEGFYLPGLGTGPVLASTDEAGLALLRFKIGRGSRNIVVPEDNMVALGFLLGNGFVETNRAPRMVLGKEIVWQPGNVYSRGAGYCG